MDVVAILRAMYRDGLDKVKIKNMYEFKDGTVQVSYGSFPYQCIRLKRSEWAKEQGFVAYYRMSTKSY
jgi:hypothetical protein